MPNISFNLLQEYIFWNHKFKSNKSIDNSYLNDIY
jgi:hypothetical protein